MGTPPAERTSDPSTPNRSNSPIRSGLTAQDSRSFTILKVTQTFPKVWMLAGELRENNGFDDYIEDGVDSSLGEAVVETGNAAVPSQSFCPRCKSQMMTIKSPFGPGITTTCDCPDPVDKKGPTFRHTPQCLSIPYECDCTLETPIYFMDKGMNTEPASLYQRNFKGNSDISKPNVFYTNQVPGTDRSVLNKGTATDDVKALKQSLIYTPKVHPQLRGRLRVAPEPTTCNRRCEITKKNTNFIGTDKKTGDKNEGKTKKKVEQVSPAHHDKDGNLMSKSQIKEGQAYNDEDVKLIENADKRGSQAYYDKDGNLSSKSDSQDVQTYFDKDGNLNENADKHDSQNYDKDGNLSSKSDLQDGQFFYDKDGNLNENADNRGSQAFHDKDENLSSQSDSQDGQTYYDKDGNLNENADKHDSQNYDKDGNLSSKSDLQDGQFFYDKDGNLNENADNRGSQAFHDKDENQSSKSDSHDGQTYDDKDGNLIDGSKSVGRHSSLAGSVRMGGSNASRRDSEQEALRRLGSRSARTFSEVSSVYYSQQRPCTPLREGRFSGPNARPENLSAAQSARLLFCGILLILLTITIFILTCCQILIDEC